MNIIQAVHQSIPLWSHTTESTRNEISIIEEYIPLYHAKKM